MNTQTQINLDRSVLLRRALWGNAFFCGASGLWLTLAAWPISQFLGVPYPLIFLGLGLGLLGYAFVVYRNVIQSSLAPGFVRLSIVLDILWVISSYVLLFTGWIQFSIAGWWAVAVVADAVAVFAVWQFVGLRRLMA